VFQLHKEIFWMNRFRQNLEFVTFGLCRQEQIGGDSLPGEKQHLAIGAERPDFYRKLNPGPVEEFIFFDHPSGRARIRMAMDWKAANLPAGDAGAVEPPAFR